MKTSNLYSIDYRDLLKAFLMAILTPVVVILQDTISKGQLTFDWKQIGIAAIGGGIAYIIKNFFTPASLKTPANSLAVTTKIETPDPGLTNN